MRLLPLLFGGGIDVKITMVVLTGSSGCGKTTLLNILGGLDRPTTGELYLDRMRVDDREEAWWDGFRSTTLGFVFQDFNLLENMTVRENIQLPLSLCGLSDEAKEAKVTAVAKELDIQEYLDKKPTKLSGGQKQRVAIARAVVGGAKIVLADEPTGNLDKQNSEIVFDMLKKIAKERLVIVVAHDTSLAAVYADRLIQLAYGTIESDQKKDVADSEETELEASTGKRKLPLKECLMFSKEAIKQRKARCLIAALMFGITIFLLLTACEALFRDDSLPFFKHIEETKQAVLPLYMSVPSEYQRVSAEEAITNGRKFYELLLQDIDNSRIVRYGEAGDIFYEAEYILGANSIYVSNEHKDYLSYTGTLPQKANEIAISQEVAKRLEPEGNAIGKQVFINEKEYLVTAVVTEICGTDISEIYVDNGFGENAFENMVFFSEQTLSENASHSLYMPGFSITKYESLYYQTTVYNTVCPVSDEVALVTGRMPEGSSEILISRRLLAQREQTADEVVGKTYKLEDIYNEKYGCTYWNEVNLHDVLGETFTVVGVGDGEGDYYIAASLYEQIAKEMNAYYQGAYCLLCDRNFLRADLKAITKNEVKMEGVNFERVYTLIETVEGMKTGIVIVILILSVLTLLQMISLFSYSINDSKKTIGVLRTLGVSNADIRKIFSVECIIVSLAALLIAIVLSLLATRGLNSFLDRDIICIEGFAFLQMRLPVVF